MGKYLICCEAFQFVGENQPLIGFMNVIVRNNVRYISVRFIPSCSNADVFGQIAAHPFLKSCKDRLDAASAIKYIVHNQQPVIPVGIPDDIFQAVNPNLFIPLVDAEIRRRPNGDMIRFNAQVVQYLLNCNCNRCAASSHADDKTGFEFAFENPYAQFERII